ncbi:MAG: hypothetical protein ACRDRO_00840 [Pseudonocardiaceae bacterium]
MNGVVCCPTCGGPAIVEGSLRVHGAGGPVGRLRITCIDGHGWLLLADRVRQVEPWEGFGDQPDRTGTIVAQRSEQVTLDAAGSAPGGAALPVDHRKAAQAE